MDIAPAFTLGIAVLGAGLGIINTWNSIADRRVRLRVVPQWSIGPGFSGFAIQVTNLSHFAVTLTEIGFTIGRARSSLPKRLPILADRVAQGPALPVRLERREVADLSFYVDGIGQHEPRKAYARTADSTIAYGSSGALRQFIKGGGKPLSL